MAKNVLKISYNWSRQTGQSMIEYTLVLAFGVLTLTTGPMQDVIAQLSQRIQDHYEGYSYAMSLSDIPDANNPLALNNLYTEQGIPDDLRIYLTDYPEGFIDGITESIPAFPDLSDAIENVDISSDLLGF